MAILNNGLSGNNKGKIGNLVYYESMGKNVVRRIGVNLNPPSPAQVNSRSQMSLISGFLKASLEYINAGFGAEALSQNRIPFNMAVSANKPNAVSGVFPDIVIDYSKAVMSIGTLKPAQNPLAVLGATGLQFSWFTEPDMLWPELSDQVMLLAYFPELKKAVFRLYGPERIAGEAFLPIGGAMLDQPMETYLSFVSADRKQASESVYTGGFNAI